MIPITSVNWADLSKVAGESGFGEPLPAGEYDVVIDSATQKTANGGKNMIVCKFKVESGPHQGRTIFNNFVISPDSPPALAFFFRHMAACGLGEQYFAGNPSLERVAGDLTGRRCVVQVSIREWSGTQRNQVDNVKPPASGNGISPGVTAPSGNVPGMPAAPRTSPSPSGPQVPQVPQVPQKPADSAPATPVIPPPPPPPPAAPSLGTDDDLPF